MNNNSARVKRYSQISTSLECLNDEQLNQILADGKPMHEGIGGKSALIYINKTPIFVKKVPITDLEKLSQNFMSTANIFNLPSYYQYGVGSAGFGAWRELAAHIMTTNWVITGNCVNFPLMYHFRVLPSGPGGININYWGDIEKYCQYWENSSTVRKRVEDLNKASTSIALFLEYVPQNLREWLSTELTKDDGAAERAVSFVDKNLKTTNVYMNTHGLMHFDAHFDNILTDGEQLYLSDFGLALSLKFNLSTAETEFLKRHQSYDQACLYVNLLHCIITSFFGEKQWQIHLRDYLADKLGNIPPEINTLINRYAPIALIMDEFFQKLQKESKTTPYPKAKLEKLLESMNRISSS